MWCSTGLSCRQVKLGYRLAVVTYCLPGKSVASVCLFVCLCMSVYIVRCFCCDWLLSKSAVCESFLFTQSQRSTSVRRCITQHHIVSFITHELSIPYHILLFKYMPFIPGELLLGLFEKRKHS